MDLDARSGCHSNVTEIKARFFFNSSIYLLTIWVVSVVSLVSVVSFRCFGF